MTSLGHHLRLAVVLLGLCATCVQLAELAGVSMLDTELNTWILSHNQKKLMLIKKISSYCKAKTRPRAARVWGSRPARLASGGQGSRTLRTAIGSQFCIPLGIQQNWVKVFGAKI
jgi:hypothetical protein